MEVDEFAVPMGSVKIQKLINPDPNVEVEQYSLVVSLVDEVAVPLVLVPFRTVAILDLNAVVVASVLSSVE